MPSEFPMNDPRNIWQNQPTEPFKMSADELRRKAQQRERKARFEAIYSTILVLLVCIFFARTFARAHEVLPRLGLGLLILWGLHFAYQARRGIWPRRLGPDATVSTSLEFYRSALERRRYYGLHIWRRSGLTFCFLGIALLVLPGLIQSDAPRFLLNNLPFFVLLAIWLAIFFPMRKRRLRKLQQEIDELRAFERGDRS